MRSATSQASNAEQNASNTAATLAGASSTEGATLTPFLTQEMLHPQGFSQQDLSAQTASAEGGAGGAASALTGQAVQRAAASHNAGGYQAALDDAARSRTKAAAGASEDIAANNANLKQQQQQEGEQGLQSKYNTDTSGMLQSAGQEAGDINAEVNANNSGWLQQTQGVLSTLGGMAGGAGQLMTGIYGNQGAKNGCWVAAEIFGGWYEPRTVIVREWLNTDFRKSLFGDLVMRFYLKFGERIAAGVRKSPALRAALTPLFELALRKAQS